MVEEEEEKKPTLEHILIERFHLPGALHTEQVMIIEQLLRGKSMLAIQRTGWGKSLCYQGTSILLPHSTLVFSPLKALMRDQCQKCNQVYQIPATIISSDFTVEENRQSLIKASQGKYKILFISPERLNNLDWQSYLPKLRISIVVIDEAHCISTWGHDFRPDYRRLTNLLKRLPDVPVLALTATANKRVEADILQQIGPARIIRGHLYRPNLYLNVMYLHGDWEKLCYIGEVLLHRTDTGIIYTATQSSAVMVAMFLSQQGIKTDYYHAGRTDEVRQDIEQKWVANTYTVICSTSALSMGIDKSDVRFVIHYHVPASLLHYYQEIGRAGRDGLPAWCILLYDYRDVAIQEHLLSGSRQREATYLSILSQLQMQPLGLSEDNLLRTTGISQIAARTILADLEEQALITYNSASRTYRGTSTIDTRSIDPSASAVPKIDFFRQEAIQQYRQQELLDMQQYARTRNCYMRELIHSLGDLSWYTCGVCRNCCQANFPSITPTMGMQVVATRFLEKDFLPHIDAHKDKNGAVHMPGWSLSYHGRSTIGILVSASKYRNAGPFAMAVVQRSVEIVTSRYPLDAIDAVVNVPSTRGSMLVDIFARQVAERLQKEYLPFLKRTRITRTQKSLTNRLQKAENVENAFAVNSAEMLAGRSLLLIDDIYDSGYTLREVGKILMQAGAKAVYPFTITRTMHADNQ